MTSKNLKHQAKVFFKKTKSVKCPTFPGEEIIFNSKGLSHLFYKGSQKVASRLTKEIATRVSLLSRAVKVIEQMPMFQEESLFITKEGKRINYWSFEAVVDNRRIKVIVRQIGNGKKHFWSVIPAWRKIRGARVNTRNDLSKL